MYNMLIKPHYFNRTDEIVLQLSNQQLANTRDKWEIVSIQRLKIYKFAFHFKIRNKKLKTT